MMKLTRRERMEQLKKEMGCILNPTSTEIKKILSAFVINQHNGATDVLDGILVMENGDTAPFYNRTYFTINPLIKDQGAYQIMMGAVGGCIRFKSNEDENLKRPIDRIKDYNDSITSGNKIKEYHCREYSIFF